MKKAVFVLSIGLITLLGSIIVMQEEQLQESKRLVLDLQDTIRMMEDEINEAYNRVDELEQQRILLPDGYGFCTN